jgi:putative peptidoglycan lipid II flippase
MHRTNRHSLIAGALVTGLGTLASRVLGMVRDMATAALFGLAAQGVMDAFVVANRIPNLFRQLFGEGALTASYLPVVTTHLEKDSRTAWQLVSVMLVWLTVLLTGVVLAGEAIVAAMWLLSGGDPELRLLLGLTATLLPYMLLICLAAQVTATLQALSHFSVPALTPTLLNVCWLTGVWVIAPWFAPNAAAQAYVVAVCILVAGVLQLGVQLPVLYRLGFRFEYDWRASRAGMTQIGRALAPMLFSLAVTQINTFTDSLIALGLAAAPNGPQTIPWLGGAVHYPLRQGAAAAIYIGERLYQFPLGIVGMAMAASIFPLLSRHAAHGRRRELAADLTLGLRLVLCLSVPAGVGLIVLAQPLAKLLFEHGHFTADDTARAARMIAAYALGVWAYCASPVMVRGFYAMGNCTTPVRVGALVVALNLALNLVLIWPLAEAGLGVSTALSAAVELLVLAVLFSKRQAPLDWRSLAAAAARTTVATVLMALTAYAVLRSIPSTAGLLNAALRVGVPITLAAAVYGVAYWLCGGRELQMLLRKSETSDLESDN